MRFITLLHNPEAGNGQISKDELLSMLLSEGYHCRYSSTKAHGIELLDPEAEFIVVAGGDGTVRKVIRQILVHQAGGRSWPVAILPLGTANNIARTLGIDGPVHQLVSGWKNSVIKKYDVGGVSGLDNGSFFLEGFGFGLFPHVMRRMKDLEKEEENLPDLRMDTAIHLLHRRLAAYKAKNCLVEVDGKDVSGKYFLVEIMNTSFIGPNLLLSSHSDPGDGRLEIVLLAEKDKVRFARYLYQRMNERDVEYPFPALKGNAIRLSWSGKLTHLDDAFFKLDPGNEVRIQIHPGTLQFLAPDLTAIPKAEGSEDAGMYMEMRRGF